MAVEEIKQNQAAPDAQTLQNIRAARTYQGTPPDEYLVPFDSIGDMLDRRAAETAHKVYLIHYDADGNREEFTYSEFNRKVNQIANFMSRVLGVKRGDRVATIGYNHSDTVILYFATWKLGAAVAPQNVAEDDNRINYILRNSEAVTLLARPEYLERAEQIVHGDNPVENIRQIVQVGGEMGSRYLHLQTEAAKQPEGFTAPEHVSREDECLLVYTSGTTGAPKGVVLTHYNMLVDARGIAEWHQLTADQRTMCVLPIHHVNGIEVTLVTPLYVGASTVLNRAYSSSHLWQRIAREKVQPDSA